MAFDSAIDLRVLVREVLREVISAKAAASGGAQAVSITCDADLQALIARLAAPGGIEAVRAGTAKYTLASTQPVALPRSNLNAAHPLEGVVSERKLQDVAPGTTIRLAASAVLTPMAKDLARRKGLTFERME